MMHWGGGERASLSFKKNFGKRGEVSRNARARGGRGKKKNLKHKGFRKKGFLCA